MSTPDDRPLAHGIHDPSRPSVAERDLERGELAGVPVLDGVREGEVLALAKRRWAEREATFPAFTRMTWEAGTWLARATALAAAEAELMAPVDHLTAPDPTPAGKGETTGGVE